MYDDMGQIAGSRFTHYTTYVAPNYKAIVFAERGNRTHRYMLEPISSSVIQTKVAHIHCNVRWGVGAQVVIVVDYARFPLNKFESLSITR